jgi:hypothetical protein
MTWNSTKVTSLKHNNNQIFISLSGKEHILEVIISSSISGKIKAPVLGVMERYIKESVDATVSLKLKSLNGKEIFNGTSVNAGLEVVGDVFQYFN